MASEPKVSVQERSAELALVEVSVLRALCRTINAESSDLKYKILDGLSKDDFSSRLTKAVFTAATEMYRQGDFVVAPEIEDALRREGVELPKDFSVDALFQGSVPDAKHVDEWLGELKKRAPRNASTTLPTASIEELARTMPPVAVDAPPSLTPVKGGDSYPPSPAALDSQSHAPNITQAWPVTETRRRVSEVAASKSTAGRGAHTSKRKTKRAPRKAGPALPRSEAEEWLAYLEAISQEPPTLTKTGFRELDDKLGGLRAGVHLVSGEDRDTVLDFLKQLADQVAQQCGLPCLYISFDRTKTTLRLRTLSRLTGLPSKELEHGRFWRTADERTNTERLARKAVDWLKRVFIVDSPTGMDVAGVRKLVEELLRTTESRSGALVVIDRLEGFGAEANSTLKELHHLAGAFPAAIVAAISEPDSLEKLLVQSKFRLDGRTLTVERQHLPETPLTLPLEYDSEIHRFQLGTSPQTKPFVDGASPGA